ncbi:MAG: aldehyde dehydrogenase family protein, partial [Myxococcales bacterium]
VPGNAAPGFIRNTEPASGRALPEVKVSTPDEVRDAVRRAREAQARWAALGFRERRRRLIAFKDLLLERAEEVAELVARENGKPTFEALVHDVLPVAELTVYYARNAKRILKDEVITPRLFPHKRSYLRHEPRGVVGIISPWNFPFSLPMGEVITALAAGNAVVVKPSEFTPLTMRKGAELLHASGIPPELVAVVPGYGATGAALLDAGVNMVVFIG